MDEQKIGRQNVIINSFVKENRVCWANPPITHAQHTTKQKHSTVWAWSKKRCSPLAIAASVLSALLICAARSRRLVSCVSTALTSHLLFTDHSWQAWCEKFSLLSSGWVNKGCCFSISAPFCFLRALAGAVCTSCIPFIINLPEGCGICIWLYCRSVWICASELCCVLPALRCYVRLSWACEGPSNCFFFPLNLKLLKCTLKKKVNWNGGPVLCSWSSVLPK